MPFFVAAIWSLSATLGLQLLAIATASLRSSDHLDVVSGVLCEAAAFLGTLFVFVRVHEPERSLRDVLGLRPAPFSLCALAALLGAASQAPFSLLGDLIEKRFPPSPEDLAAQAEVFAAPTPLRKIALILAVGIVGPLVEELFFRGGLYRGIRRGRGMAAAVSSVAVFFAAVHLGSFPVPLFLIPVFLVGLLLGYVRGVSGSLLPAVLLHAAFNSTSAVISILPGSGPDEGLNVPLGVSLGALAVSAVLFVVYRAVAARNPACREARELDLA